MTDEDTDAWITLAEALKRAVESLELQMAALKLIEADDDR